MGFFKRYLYLSFVMVLVFGCGDRQGARRNQTGAPALEKIPSQRQVIFDYQPEKPKNGELYAAIELGSLGLNYFIVAMDQEGRWDLKDSFYGKSNIIYGSNNSTKIISEIERYLTEIKSNGVDQSNIHLVASSSAVQLEDISNLNTLLTKTGYVIKSISPDDEAKYALNATIPREFANESFMVDIGSGNGKLSWINANDTLSIEIHGSKYFLNGIQDTTVFREVRNALLEIPQRNRNLCFMLGGTIYEFLKEEIRASPNRYFVLQPPGSYPKSTDQFRAGNVIYSALYLEPTYSYIFDSQSNFSIGYLKSIRNK